MNPKRITFPNLIYMYYEMFWLGNLKNNFNIFNKNGKLNENSPYIGIWENPNNFSPFYHY